MSPRRRFRNAWEMDLGPPRAAVDAFANATPRPYLEDGGSAADLVEGDIFQRP
jgi:hypothetical protein